MNRFEKTREDFYIILNESNNKVRELQILFSPLANRDRINLLNDYFSEIFNSGATKLKNSEKTLIIMEELNKSIQLYDVVNKTPNAAYDLLLSCNTIEKMQWAIEKMKINPICFSDKLEKVYYIKGPINTAGRQRGSFVIAPYINILAFSQCSNGDYTILEKQNSKYEDIKLIKKELIYNFMNNPSILKYLLKYGCGTEINNKKFDKKEIQEYIFKNSFQEMLGTIIFVGLIVSLFFSINRLTIATSLIIGTSIFFWLKRSSFNDIESKFQEMRQYFLKLKEN